jgi:hypothetical protein
LIWEILEISSYSVIIDVSLDSDRSAREERDTQQRFITKKLIIFPFQQWIQTKIFNGTKLARVLLAPVAWGTCASGRKTTRIFPTNEAWPNRRLTAENGGNEWQNGGGSVVESRAGSEHARSLRRASIATGLSHARYTCHTHGRGDLHRHAVY